MRKSRICRDRAVAIMMIACLVTVAFWEIMAKRSRFRYRALQLTGDDFVEFRPESDNWSIRSIPIISTPKEPNIIAYKLMPIHDSRLTINDAARARVLVRLAHGYNMPDCMRFKGYGIELIDDKCPEEVLGRIQAWRLTGRTGDVSIWVTSILRRNDFSGTDIDVRTMAFPRIGVPLDPGWTPSGMSWKSLRHPVRNFRLLLRSKWNDARCDLATFLKLKQPEWVSGDLLTLVSYSGTSSVSASGSGTDQGVKSKDEEAVAKQVLAAHAYIHSELRAWAER